MCKIKLQEIQSGTDLSSKHGIYVLKTTLTNLFYQQWQLKLGFFEMFPIFVKDPVLYIDRQVALFVALHCDLHQICIKTHPPLMWE